MSSPDSCSVKQQQVVISAQRSDQVLDLFWNPVSFTRSSFLRSIRALKWGYQCGGISFDNFLAPISWTTACDPALLPPAAASPKPNLTIEEAGSMLQNNHGAGINLPSKESMEKKVDSCSQNLIVVVVEALRERARISLRAPKWALENVAQAGDVLTVLGVLQPVTVCSSQAPHPFKLASNLLRYKVKDHREFLLGTSMTKMRDEAAETKISKFYSKCMEKGVKLFLEIKTGDISRIAIEHATATEATCVVLERGLKKYKNYFLDQLPCKIILMRRRKPPNTLQEDQPINIMQMYKDNMLNVSTNMFPRASFSEDNIANDKNQTRNKLEQDFSATKSKLHGVQAMKITMVPNNAIGTNTSSTGLNTRWPREDSICSDSSQISSNSIDSPFSALQVLYSPVSFQDSLASHKDIMAPSSCNTNASKVSFFNSGSIHLHYSSLIPNYPSKHTSFEGNININSIAKPLDDLTLQQFDPEHEVRAISVQPRKTFNSYILGNFLSPQQHALEYDLENMDNLKAMQFVDNLVEGKGLARETMKWQGSMMTIHKDVNSQGFSRQSTIISDDDTIQIPIIIENDTSLLCRNSIQNINVGHFLCSICKQRSPDFGKRPTRFGYEQLQVATNDFSEKTFLGEGRFGSIYKGLLEDGQVVAVKQVKQLSTQIDTKFHLKVDLLSCAQHCNLVMLLGYCDEKDHRFLVYEYVCNKSLSWHMSKKNNPNGLEWWARQKIAVGMARGLRYLHEECRVGCIIHQNVRPESILLTHEFQAMVGTFGIARWLKNIDESAQTEITGSQGYEAPEYARSGKISWKSDVYAFGVILLELITGQNATDRSPELGQQSLVRWAWPLLLERRYHELLDPRLESSHDTFELVSMVRAASLCLTEDPSSRPRISQVLHILEGESSTNDSPADGLLESFPQPYVCKTVLPSHSDHTSPREETTQNVLHTSSSSKRKKGRVLLTYGEMLQ